jgi:hypothetical protein
MESVNDVKQALSARARTATLDELRSEGRKQVRVIKAEHIAALIQEAVHTAIERTGLIPKEEAVGLVERSRQEFRALLKEREDELKRATEVEELLKEREEELQRLGSELQDARAALTTIEQTRGAAGAAGATGAAVGVTPDLSAALEKLAGSLNERLETIGKKMGVSAAVEGGDVKLDGLFKHDDKKFESNIENVQIKQRAGGGIAANLERLKKLKGGG